MSNLLNKAIVLSFALGASGCASSYSSIITSFDQGFSASQKIIQDRALAMNAVNQRISIEKNFDKDSLMEPVPARKDPTLLEFSLIVCASSKSLVQQQNAIAVLGVYDKAIDTIGKVPNQDVGSLVKSIVDNWSKPDALKPPALTAKNAGQCGQEVRDLISMDQGTVPEFAPAAATDVLSAAQGLYTNVNQTLVFLLGITDDYVRGQKLKKYVLASQGTGSGDGKILDTLNKLTAEDKAREAAVCTQMEMAAPCQLSTLDLATIAQKWAALRKPWHLYRAMLSTNSNFKADYDDAIAENTMPPDPARYRYLLDKQQDELTAALSDYQTLSNTPGAGDIAKAMSNANSQLVKLANGDITADQAWAIMQAFAQDAQTAQKDYASISTASATLRQSVSALQ